MALDGCGSVDGDGVSTAGVFTTWRESVKGRNLKVKAIQSNNCCSSKDKRITVLRDDCINFSLMIQGCKLGLCITRSLQVIGQL